MQIFPLTTLSDLMDTLTSILDGNMLNIIPVLCLAIAFTFIIRWFWKSVPIFPGDGNGSSRQTSQQHFTGAKW